MITSNTPSTWQELQNGVARILSECGFDVEVEKKVGQAGRGTVEIDVYAIENVAGRRYVALCECKHWQARIPQHVVHAFRTVMAEAGANVGYIISTAGFQPGALEAAANTPVKLVTWSEFQEAFEESWLNTFFTPQITERLDPFMTFVEPFPPKFLDKLPTHEQAAWMALVSQYEHMGFLTMQFASYLRAIGPRPYPRLPLRALLEDTSHLPDDLLDATGYRELFESLVTHGEHGITQFRAIRDRNGHNGGE